MQLSNKQKKIIILYSGFVSKGGGVVTHSLSLKKIFQDQGYDVDLWSLDDGKVRGIIAAGAEKLLNKILPPYGIIARYFLTQVLFYFKIKKLISGYDRVIFQNAFFFPVFKGKHIYYFNHGFRYMYLKDFPYFCRLGRKILEKYELRRVAKVEERHIYISSKLKDYILNKYSLGAKSFVLENFIEFPKELLPKPWHEKKGCVFAGFLGKVKNPFFVLDIATALKKLNYFDEKIRIIGRGPLEDKLKAEVNSRDLQDMVSVEGALPNNDVLKVLTESRYVLLPSEFENFPFTLVEGRLAGCFNIINEELFLIPDEFSDVALPCKAEAWAQIIISGQKPSDDKLKSAKEKYDFTKQVGTLFDLMEIL